MESWRVKVHMRLTTFTTEQVVFPGHIDLVHCFSAVGSALPARAAACKGGGVHSSKSHVSWVKNGASQFVLYLLRVLIA
ncbi:MAG: hypothetical protein DRO99_04425 [Candidatus Aenigmatarchaeota archaeon]|nr:MAG: hypothetical protein DRO99_04425 [Candidatus Aenigmarchaeota archaeon]